MRPCPCPCPAGAAQAAEGEPYRTPELSQQSVARVRQRFDRIMAHTKDGHVRAACERVHGYLAELGGADWESCFWRLCADDLTTGAGGPLLACLFTSAGPCMQHAHACRLARTHACRELPTCAPLAPNSPDWPMKMEHLAEALGAPNLAGLDRLLHNISCRLSCEALATPTTVFLYQREWSSSTSLHRTAARFSRGVQRAAERAAQFKQVLATAATRMLPPKAAQEVQRAAGGWVL